MIFKTKDSRMGLLKYVYYVIIELYVKIVRYSGIITGTLWRHLCFHKAIMFENWNMQFTLKWRQSTNSYYVVLTELG